jgi:succinylarginine dihydrolase
MIRFTKHDEGGMLRRIEFQISDEATLDEVLDEFTNFLRACSYTIEYNRVLDFVDREDD